VGERRQVQILAPLGLRHAFIDGIKRRLDDCVIHAPPVPRVRDPLLGVQ
jgi:hypothetical protein